MSPKRSPFEDQECGMLSVFEDWTTEVRTTLDKVDIMHNSIQELAKHTAHLPKLDNIASTLAAMNGNLISAATGREHTDNRTVKLIVYILGGVIAVLITIIGFILTGQRFGILPLPH